MFDDTKCAAGNDGGAMNEGRYPRSAQIHPDRGDHACLLVPETIMLLADAFCIPPGFLHFFPSSAALPRDASVAVVVVVVGGAPEIFSRLIFARIFKPTAESEKKRDDDGGGEAG